ncbi:[FeFe] hydrogenase H-cluster maturation GTPase HydF [Hathewaya limosa]|uniref:[FeFe] hydrogenase H-cluster maturation GTPase HydF n=1 Tax=Hathewaya limosa TaxID=1536 RepID=A0ABU0JNL1_HATLI|nr:[FeFe] hydrogenase H-cluster maturation GTPase HydF [Hathewaya limosa]MDQ0478648.1 [FeFe] hydrogenase H-cluster maturation GTPase HydF [Hathewaya limosa]
MNNTPNANRKQIGIYGKRNAGKSSLVNLITGQEVALVSDVKGTTTDPVFKTMELIPFGPVRFIDTAGLDDEGVLGELRVKKTFELIQITDLALYVMDVNDIDEKSFKDTVNKFKQFNIPYIVIFNKIDTLNEKELKKLKERFPKEVFISTKKQEGVDLLREEIIKELKNAEEEPRIMEGLLSYNSKVILVVPIDSEAPKGRLILPQVQVIRDCLDHGIKSYVVRDTELESAIKDTKDIDLVITDSQAFKRVNKIVPQNISLTSFSILFARHKGEINAFVKGVSKIKELKEGSKILMMESCTHNTSHEDIGRVKIPQLINKFVDKKLNFEFRTGNDFPQDIEKYDLVIHCGACMMTRKTILNRIQVCKEKDVPITNYGITIAYLTGILDRAIEIFK